MVSRHWTDSVEGLMLTAYVRPRVLLIVMCMSTIEMGRLNSHTMIGITECRNNMLFSWVISFEGVP